MKKNSFYIFCLLLCGACATSGEHFFIQNTGDQAVHVDFELFENNNEPDSTRVKFSMDPFVYISKQTVNSKAIRQFPFRASTNFDTLRIYKNGETYHLDIQPNKLIVIPPIYLYSQNVDHLIIDGKDSLQFSQEYPGIDEMDVYYSRLYKRKDRLFNADYRFIILNNDSINHLINNTE